VLANRFLFYWVLDRFLTGDSRLGFPPSGNKSPLPPGLLVAAGAGTMFLARYYDGPFLPST
jgi:hypothetical protein